MKRKSKLDDEVLQIIFATHRKNVVFFLIMFFSLNIHTKKWLAWFCLPRFFCGQQTSRELDVAGFKDLLMVCQSLEISENESNLTKIIFFKGVGKKFHQREKELIGCKPTVLPKRNHLVPKVKNVCFSWITIHFRYLKWRNPHLYKLYGYGLCKGKPTPK